MRKNHSNTNFMRSVKNFHWMEIITILFPILTLFWMLHQDDIAMMNRLDTTISEFQASNRCQTERTDKLYEMFIDLIKRESK